MSVTRYPIEINHSDIKSSMSTHIKPSQARNRNVTTEKMTEGIK